MSKNDDAIIKLKATIEERRNAIGPKMRFAPVTSCSLELDGQRYNLHVLNSDELTFVLCKLKSLFDALNNLKQADVLQMDDTLMISGFSVSDWMDDICALLTVRKQKKLEDQLKVYADKLDKLLSADKKTELEIAEIAAMLK